MYGDVYRCMYVIGTNLYWVEGSPIRRAELFAQQDGPFDLGDDAIGAWLNSENGAARGGMGGELGSMHVRQEEEQTSIIRVAWFQVGVNSGLKLETPRIVVTPSIPVSLAGFDPRFNLKRTPYPDDACSWRRKR